MEDADIALLIDHTVLVGLTHYDAQEQMTHQEQFLATITGRKKDSIAITLPDGSERTLPPDYLNIAPRGEYECLATGEKVTNPDFISAWLVTIPDDEKGGLWWAPDSAPFHNPQAPIHWRHTYYHDPDHLKSVIDTRSTEYLGKHVLIGLTYYDPDDPEKIIERKQIHGDILRISFKEGIVIGLSNGEEYKLPPDLPSLEPAPPNEYTLHSTGEIVIDPDYITRWTVRKDPPKNEPDT